MQFRYLIKELYYRKRRALAGTLGLSIGVALLILIHAVSAGYREAARAPLQEIGTDITVQRSGNVPEKLAGPVFPCSAVTIRDEDVKRIETLPGVSGVGKAVLLWVFDPKRAWIVLGVEQQNSIGPSILGNSVIEGRFLKKDKPEAVVEVSYARQFGIKVGGTISVAGRDYPVVGLVDASGVAKIAVANVYLPLSEAQRLAASSKELQAVSPFNPGDVNLLFLRADQEKIGDLSSALRTMMGMNATIGTPDSFLRLLGSMFALSDKFALSASFIAILVAVLIAFKTMAGNVTERAKEIGVLKAAGWTNRNVVTQLVVESVVECLLAGILGLLIALVAAYGISFLRVHIPIPWEMSPRPHFLPGGGDQLFKTLRLPVQVSWTLALFAVVVSGVIGCLTAALLGRSISRIKPSEVLRHE